MQRKMMFTAMVAVCLMLLCATVFAQSVSVKKGMRGELVRIVQDLLIAQGYLEGEATGVCEDLTVDAIKTFQQDHGLEADGICGPLTYAKLGGTELIEDAMADQLADEAQEMPEWPDPYQGQVIYVTATAYSSQDPGNSNYTASGTLVRRGVIAVDPTVIPLGTQVFIPGYGYAIAEDIGGNIQGHRIDLAFDTREEALAFGRQDVEVYIK